MANKEKSQYILITHNTTVKNFDNWSPNFELVWTHNKRSLIYIDRTNRIYNQLDDISVSMHKRALSGYGLSSKFNVDLLENEKLRSLWNWIFSKSLRDESRFKVNGNASTVGDDGFYGIRLLIKGDPNLNTNGVTLYRSEIVTLPWPGLPDSLTAKVYRSPNRDKALQLCGWGCEPSDGILDGLIRKLQGGLEFQRAAALAVFNLNLRDAIKILMKGAEIKRDTTLNATAMALSGFSDDKNTLWCEMCTQLRSQLNHPYLQAMFAFLTAENENYGEILFEKGLQVQDRVAFACIFLSDHKLVEYLDCVTVQVIESGSLDGILLTGLSNDGLNLIQRYVDITGDIQTASLAIVNALPLENSADYRIEQWIESYRDLLDQWRLWNERAEFDVEWSRQDGTHKPTPQVFISCNYCGKSVVSYNQNVDHTRPYAKLCTTPNKSKLTCCPGCRKPLPRCALCLINMGTASGLIQPAIDEMIAGEDEQKLSLFSNWFTWCQTCRHGGHANHMADWFREHVECPVTGCSCKCMVLDAVNRLALANT